MTARDEHDWLAERFEAHRTHLRGVAYRMLGSASEADDAVQEAWLRVSRADTTDVENFGGWLTTLVARVSLDMLRSRNARREESLGTQPSLTNAAMARQPDPPRRGATEWAKGAVEFSRRARLMQPAVVLVDGEVSAAWAPGGRIVRLLRFRFAGERIAAIDVIADPVQLANLELSVLEG